jgi:hypothetical protein
MARRARTLAPDRRTVKKHHVVPALGDHEARPEAKPIDPFLRVLNAGQDPPAPLRRPLDGRPALWPVDLDPPGAAVGDCHPNPSLSTAARARLPGLLYWREKLRLLGCPALRLSDAERMLSGALVTFEYDQTGVIRPAIATLTRCVPRSARQIKRLLASLVARGLLVVREAGGGRGRPTSYRLQWELVRRLAADSAPKGDPEVSPLPLEKNDDQVSPLRSEEGNSQVSPFQDQTVTAGAKKGDSDNEERCRQSVTRVVEEQIRTNPHHEETAGAGANSAPASANPQFDDTGAPLLDQDGPVPPPASADIVCWVRLKPARLYVGVTDARVAELKAAFPLVDVAREFIRPGGIREWNATTSQPERKRPGRKGFWRHVHSWLDREQKHAEQASRRALSASARAMSRVVPGTICDCGCPKPEGATLCAECAEKYTAYVKDNLSRERRVPTPTPFPADAGELVEDVDPPVVADSATRRPRATLSPPPPAADEIYEDVDHPAVADTVAPGQPLPAPIPPPPGEEEVVGDADAAVAAPGPRERQVPAATPPPVFAEEIREDVDPDDCAKCGHTRRVHAHNGEHACMGDMGNCACGKFLPRQRSAPSSAERRRAKPAGTASGTRREDPYLNSPTGSMSGAN